MSTPSRRNPSRRAKSIRFDDLVPKKEIRGGKAEDKVLFGTIDYSVQEELYGTHRQESNPKEDTANQPEGDQE